MHRSYLNCLVLLITLAFLIPFSCQAETSTAGNTGIYRFHGNVEGAEVYVDGILKGAIFEGILDVPVDVAGASYHTYSLQKEGYETYNGTINSVPARGQVISIYVPMSAKPMVEYSRVHLLISPPLAEVTWDGVSAGTVPDTGILILREVVPGSHRLTVTKEGYETLSEILSVPRNDIMKVPLTLKPVAKGSITIDSVPAGASVYLDDRNVGVSPLTVHDIPAGPHAVRISGEGFQDSISSVDVTAGGTAAVSVTLLPATGSAGKTSASLSPLVMIAGLAVAALCVACRRI
ncbi:MAG: PEGA domain protein [Methanoregulaceae archaeon PtaU1.Bin222]|nr:MAG: PEGA domain protein [Methanoregulaceae archaeon PtaU1.Bin222]